MATLIHAPPHIPRFWTDWFGQEWSPWTWSLAMVVLALVLGTLFGQLVLFAATRWAQRTETLTDDAIVKHLRRPLRVLFPLSALVATLPWAALEERTEGTVHQVLVVLMTLTIGWVCFRITLVLEEVVESRYVGSAADNVRARAIRTQVRGLRNIAGFVIAVLTFGFALLSFDAVRQVGAGLLASAGIVGIILGVAAQRSLATIFAGLQIAIAQPIRVEDVVIVEGEWGRIEEITLTYVVVRIWDLRRLVVPINYFIEKPFQNWTRNSSDILGTAELYVDYTVDVERLRGELRRIVEASPFWDKKHSGLQVTGANDKAMLIRALVSAKDSSDAWNLRCEVREKLIAFLRQHDPTGLPRIRSAGAEPSRTTTAALASAD